MFRFPTYDPVPIDSDGIPGGGAGMGGGGSAPDSQIKHDGFRSELLPSYSGDAASLVLPRLVSRNIAKLGRDWRASAGRRQPNSNSS
jgi:hypothetical protein